MTGRFIYRNPDRVCYCKCTEKANSRHKLEMAGLAKQAERFTFDKYTTFARWRKPLKEKAMKYTTEWKKHSFFIAGQSGAGKSHLCTAIINVLIEQGISFEYIQWVKISGKLKALVNDPEAYERELKKYKDCDLLYIDDFLKQDISAADIRLAYEIIDARYTSGKPIIISSERTLDYINSLQFKDDSGAAIAGRIKEMTGDCYCNHVRGEEKNYRFYGDESQ